MIIVGYQGIGKSTLSYNKINNYIDLESSYFHEYHKPDDWYIRYCNVAKSLSDQGYDVFVSSHQVVREYLAKLPVRVICVVPSEDLKDAWISKLQSRFESTHKDKDYRAWKNAEERYIDNIREIKESGFDYIEINNIDYNLYDVLRFGHIYKTPQSL